MNLPTEEQCLNYFIKYRVPLNIYSHCLKVQKVANFLAREMNKKGVQLNLELVNCLALLHDLFKVVAIPDLRPNKFHDYQHTSEEIEMWDFLRKKYPDIHEGEVAYLIFKDEFPELALALKGVSSHEKKEKSWEEWIVHYADWRTFRNEIISLPERLAYLKEQYAGYNEYWVEREQMMQEIENKITQSINLNPEKLKQLVEIKNG